MQLLAAVATHGAEDVARCARRMHTHQHRLVGVHIPLDYGDVFQPVAFLTEWYELEIAVFGGKVHLLPLLYQRFFLHTVGNEVADGYEFKAPLVCTAAQLRQACHRAVVAHDLHEGSSRTQSCQTGKVDSGLGMPRAAEHTLVLGIKRIDVAGTAKCFGSGCRICQGADGGAAVVD